MGPVGLTSPRVAAHGRSLWRTPALLLLSLVAQLLTFALTIVAAHLLDAADYGRWMGLFGVFGALALPTTVIQLLGARHLAEASTADSGTDGPAVTTGFLRQVRRWLPPIVILTGLVITSLAGLAAPLLNLPRGPLLAIAALAWGTGAALAWWRGRVQGARRFATLGAALVLEAGSRLLVFVALVRVFRLPAHWALAGAVLAAALAAGVALFARTGHADAAPIASTPALRAARAALLVTVASGVLSSLDLVWARATLPSVAAGTFAAGTLASRPFLLLASVAGTIALPYAARGSLPFTGLLRAAVLLGAAGTVLALLLWPLAPSVARLLYPSSYAAAASSIRVAALGSAWLAPALFLANAALGLERPRGQTSFAILTAMLVLVTFAVARSPAGFWSLAGATGAVHLALLARTDARRRRPV